MFQAWIIHKIKARDKWKIRWILLESLEFTQGIKLWYFLISYFSEFKIFLKKFSIKITESVQKDEQ